MTDQNGNEIDGWVMACVPLEYPYNYTYPLPNGYWLLVRPNPPSLLLNVNLMSPVTRRLDCGCYATTTTDHHHSLLFHKAEAENNYSVTALWEFLDNFDYPEYD